jgi:hypothetical protein
MSDRLPKRLALLLEPDADHVGLDLLGESNRSKRDLVGSPPAPPAVAPLPPIDPLLQSSWDPVSHPKVPLSCGQDRDNAVMGRRGVGLVGIKEANAV